MSRYCVDTSGYSFFQRGDEPVVELFDSAEWLGIPATVLGEIEVGFLLGNQSARNRQALDRFLDHPSVSEIPTNHRIGEIYAELLVALRRAGTPIPTNDIWIGAAAVVTGSTVVSYDAHFKQMPQVRSLILPQPSR